jgi:hypothetical protein
MRFGLKRKRIGWVITDQLVTMPLWPRIDTGVGGVSLARLHWIALRVNRDPSSSFCYEVFNPWRRYDGLVLLKAMGDKALRLARRYINEGKPVIFDANVNYYTTGGVEHYAGMLPTLAQQQEAIAITRAASAVIADSNYIAGHCRDYNTNVTWIPDNVEIDQVPPLSTNKTSRRMRLAWSGEDLKLFELLEIEQSLRSFRNHIDLVLVTKDPVDMSRWQLPYRQRMENLLSDLDAKVIPYRNVEQLFDIYIQSDAVLSPRLLDNSYNLGHTEWKITLGMACGCRALASPVPSYRDVWARSSGTEIVLCDTQDKWHSAFETMLTTGVSWDARARSQRIVEKYYSSRVIAGQHISCVERLFSDA